MIDISERDRVEEEQEYLLAVEREERLFATTLAEITLALTAQISPANVLQEILQQVQRIVSCQKASIRVLVDGNKLRTVQDNGEKGVSLDRDQPLSSFPLDNEIVQSRKTVIISDTQQEPRWITLSKTAWVRSHIAVPICLGERVLGLLRLDADTPNKFSTTDAERLQPFANAAAIALENARLYEQAQQEIYERKQIEEAARRAEQQYRNLFEEAPVMYVITRNQDGIPIITDCNKQFFNTLGYSSAEVIGRSLSDFYTADSQVKLLSGGDYQRTLKGNISNEECSLQTRDGRIIETLLHTSREVEDTGNVIGTRAMFVDITGRKQAAEALRKSEELFRGVISSISDHIYVTRVLENGNRVMLYMSPHVEAMTGYPIENFLNDWRFWPSTVIHPEDRAAAAAQAEQNALGKRSEVEYRLIRADGTTIWVRDSATVQSEEGTTSRIVYGLVSDITERKQAELEREWLTKELKNINQTLDERVRARTAELQAIFDAAGEGIVVTTLSGIIEYVNPAMEKLTGYSAEEVIGQTPRIWKSEQQHSTFYSQMWQTIFAGQTWRGELVNKRKNGSIYDALLTITPIPGPNEEPVGFVGMQSDITPFKEMDRLKSEFVSMAAHELRTPLTSILGFSEILLTRQLTEDRRSRYLSFINQQANALRAILDDLLDLSRLESGQGFEISDTVVDLKDIITEIVFGFQENNPKHHYNIISPDGWPHIKGDASKLAQLFKNLYSNATKYSPDGGEITLQVAVQQEYGLLHLSLSDQGIGMTQEQVAQVFERFYRADASNTAIGGTGLGMTISRLIVERHRGKIWIESEYSKGTTIHLLFPLIDRRTYILIIEDDQSLRELQQRVLRSEGFTVFGADDGFSGLKFAKTGLPDVILLDLALPGLAGFDVLEQLQANYLTKDIPVVITSAIDTATEIERAIQKGAVDYLVKPYSMGDLNIRVNRALAKSPIRTVSGAQIISRSNKWPS